MSAFISSAGGYLQNPDATSGCQFCGVNNSDQYLASYFNIFYDHRWRNIGFMIVFSMFNVRFFLFEQARPIYSSFSHEGLRDLCLDVSFPNPYGQFLTVQEKENFMNFHISLFLDDSSRIAI